MENKVAKSILILLSVTVELLTLRVWFVCKNFTDIFHHTSINLTLQLDGYIHADKGTPFILTRLFHNKLIQIIIDYIRFYLQFWDVRFGSNWFSLIGYFGIFAGFYYILVSKNKKIYHWGALSSILLLPFIEIIVEPQVNIVIKSIYLWVPFMLFSLYGLYQFLSHGDSKKRLSFLILLLIISLLWIIYLPPGINRYCIR
jgi:hypothetical protein